MYLHETCFEHVVFQDYVLKKEIVFTLTSGKVHVLFVFEKKSVKVTISMFTNTHGWYTPNPK